MLIHRFFSRLGMQQEQRIEAGVFILLMELAVSVKVEADIFIMKG